MELGELPMIAFTVISQMCVGAFVVLGLVQLIGSAKYSPKVIDRLADPALFAIGPAMIAGLIASMFHMHDVFNIFNVIRHWQSSWLSREIIFGVGFAGLGFLFFIMQALKIGSARLRQALAVLTAIFGVGLVICQVMIYYSLPTVPAWNTWATWVQFFGTTIILGALAIGAAFVLVVSRRKARLAAMTPEELAAVTVPQDATTGSYGDRMKDFLTDRRIADAQTREQVDTLLTTAVRGTVVLAIAAAGVLMIAMPSYASSLASMGEPGMIAASHYASGFAIARFALLVVGAFLLGLIAFYYAGFGVAKLRTLGFLMVSAFILVLIGEFMGRYLFYEVMTRIGV